MLRWFLIGCTIGAIAGCVLAIGIHLDVQQETAAVVARSLEVETKLAPLADHLELVRVIEDLSKRQHRTGAVIDSLERQKIDARILDEAIIEVASAASVSLENAEWDGLDVFVTFRADNAKQMVLFAEGFARHSSIGSVEIKRWKNEELPDRFLVRARWVPDPGVS